MPTLRYQRIEEGLRVGSTVVVAELAGTAAVVAHDESECVAVAGELAAAAACRRNAVSVTQTTKRRAATAAQLATQRTGLGERVAARASGVQAEHPLLEALATVKR